MTNQIHVIFFDEYGKEVCKMTIPKENLQRVCKNVQDQMWENSRINVSRWEVQEL